MTRPPDKLTAALWEADRHAAALERALADWHRVQVTALAQLESDPDLVRLVDQILFRFTKLQDCMGERPTVATLASLAEPYEDWPMRDRLHRLEKLGFIDTDDWLRWRALRHRLAHEYPGQDDLRFATLLEGIRGAAELLAACRHWMLQLAAR